MPAINKLIAAVLKGHPITSVRFSTLPDELHAVRKTRDGKVTLQLGKTTIPAEVWMAKQTRRFRNFSPNTPGYLGPKSSTNANNVEVYSQKRGWVPLKSLPDKPQSPRKLHCALRQSMYNPTGGKAPRLINTKFTYSYTVPE